MHKDEKNAYMAKKIVRMGGMNCFLELASVNWHLHVGMASVSRCKEKKKL
jgi:hypothetical protein